MEIKDINLDLLNEERIIEICYYNNYIRYKNFSYYYSNVAWIEYYDDKQMLHREDGPAFIQYNIRTKQISLHEYHVHGKLHNENDAARIHYHNGSIVGKQFYLNGKHYNIPNYLKENWKDFHKLEIYQ